jgi:hypothetical protein
VEARACSETPRTGFVLQLYALRLRIGLPFAGSLGQPPALRGAFAFGCFLSGPLAKILQILVELLGLLRQPRRVPTQHSKENRGRAVPGVQHPMHRYECVQEGPILVLQSLNGSEIGIGRD